MAINGQLCRDEQLDRISWKSIAFLEAKANSIILLDAQIQTML
jgi:hypothetical protein